jgi:Fe-S-cluster containining protein
MTGQEKLPGKQPQIDTPAYWDETTMQQKWLEFLKSSLKEHALSIPFKRVQFQIENTSIYFDTVKHWHEWDSEARLAAWKRLLQAVEQALQEILPICVQCGECCRKGSPTLHLEDLELLRLGVIPWEQLVTLREGEPVYSPFDRQAFLLISECIKLREKDGSKECVFLDEDTSRCTIYTHRPVQCRAQACWDAAPAKQLTKSPHLTREEIFSGVDLLLDVIAEHDRRFALRKIHKAFEELTESQGANIEEVLELLAYEEHFRQFFSERFNISRQHLDLVFGRTVADLTPLFGFRVKLEQDGSRCLAPDEPQEEASLSNN